MISKIISAGQTGIERAALDEALAHSLPYGGWYALDASADNFHEPQKLIARYNCTLAQCRRKAPT